MADPAGRYSRRIELALSFAHQARARGRAQESVWAAVRLSQGLVEQSKRLLADSRNYYPWGI